MLILNILNKLKEIHNDYLLAPDETEIKRKVLSNYQLKIAELYNIPNGNLNKLEPNFFEKEKYVIHYELATLLKIRTEAKKIYCVLEFNKSQYVEFNTQKRIEAEKMVAKLEKRCTD